jgi:hypothetical protein
LANDTSKNGGWWFYKWYGDMSGQMVKTTPVAQNNVSTLDGFANLDITERFASVLFAGENDGTIQVTIGGFAATGIFGSTVHAVVERTPWVNRSTVVNGTVLLSEADLPISGDQVEFTVDNASDFDGYRIYLTSNEPVDPGSGGAGTGGTESGGAASSGGGPAGGGLGTGGTPGATTGGGAAIGGAGMSTGGASAMAGGAFSAGGVPSAGGMASGGSSEVGGGGGTTDESGCSCRAAGSPARAPWGQIALTFGALAIAWLRRLRGGSFNGLR